MSTVLSTSPGRVRRRVASAVSGALHVPSALSSTCSARSAYSQPCSRSHCSTTSTVRCDAVAVSGLAARVASVVMKCARHAPQHECCNGRGPMQAEPRSLDGFRPVGGSRRNKKSFEGLYALLRVFVALKGPWLRFGSRCWCFGRALGALVGRWSGFGVITPWCCVERRVRLPFLLLTVRQGEGCSSTS